MFAAGLQVLLDWRSRAQYNQAVKDTSSVQLSKDVAAQVSPCKGQHGTDVGAGSDMVLTGGTWVAAPPSKAGHSKVE
jgi:hypothetical protein